VLNVQVNTVILLDTQSSVNHKEDCNAVRCWKWWEELLADPCHQFTHWSM